MTPRDEGQPLVALYSLEIHLAFAGPRPEVFNRAAPEVTDAHHAAVDAARAVLEEHGFSIAHCGHGSRRIDKPFAGDRLAAQRTDQP